MVQLNSLSRWIVNDRPDVAYGTKRTFQPRPRLSAIGVTADILDRPAIATDKVYAEGEKPWLLLKCWESESLLLRPR
jgi:hypothetical protein